MFHLSAHSRWPSRPLNSSPLFGERGGLRRTGFGPGEHRGTTEGAFLLEQGIAARNLSVNADGAVRVELDSEWRTMLEEVSQWGPVLVITRNEAAVLARFMTYPSLRFSGEYAEDGDGELHLDFHWWQQAYARHARLPKGKGYAIEFLDSERQAFHSVALTAESDQAAYFDWLQRHQALSRREQAWRERRVQPVGIAAVEVACPEVSEMTRDEPERPFAIRQLQPLLEKISSEEMPVRAAVGHEGSIQQHCFRPREVRRSGSWIFCSDDETGLHFDLSGVAFARIHTFLLHGIPCRSLKAYHANGRLLFFLAPTGPAHLERWNTLLAEEPPSH